MATTVRLKNGDVLKGKLINLGMVELEILVGEVHQKLKLRDVARLNFLAESVPSPQSNNKAAFMAIKALPKLDSAVSVGVNLQEYGTRLADAKTDCDRGFPVKETSFGASHFLINYRLPQHRQILRQE